MIHTDYFETRDDGVVLLATYSDAGVMIEQEGTGARYSLAIDPDGSGRVYTETDEPIEDEATVTDYIEALQKLGVITDEES